MNAENEKEQILEQNEKKLQELDDRITCIEASIRQSHQLSALEILCLLTPLFLGAYLLFSGK